MCGLLFSNMNFDRPLLLLLFVKNRFPPLLWPQYPPCPRCWSIYFNYPLLRGITSSVFLLLWATVTVLPGRIAMISKIAPGPLDLLPLYLKLGVCFFLSECGGVSRTRYSPPPLRTIRFFSRCPLKRENPPPLPPPKIGAPIIHSPPPERIPINPLSFGTPTTLGVS